MPRQVFNDSSHLVNDDFEGEMVVESRLTRLETQFGAIESTLRRIEAKLTDEFVSHVEFWPVKTIVYTGAGFVMLSVLAAVVTLVLIAAK